MPKEKAPRAAKAEKPKKKDGPKRPLSAYMLFSQEERNKIKDANPNASFGDIGKLLGEAWKNLPDPEKKPYQDKAEKDKKRYQDEVAAGKAE